MTRFSDAYVAAILDQPTQTPDEAQIVQLSDTHMLGAPAKAIVFGALEQIGRAKMGLDPTTPIDWGGVCPPDCRIKAKADGTIDWAALIAALAPILAMLLPLLIPLL